MSDEKKEQIAKKILEYLIKHPHAQDTLEGVLNWWVRGFRIKHRTARVKQALDELVADGLVISWTTSDSQIHYQINIERLDEIISLVQQKR